MKQLKCLLAILLIVCLVVCLFAACAKTEPSGTETPAQTNTDSEPAKPDTSNNTEPVKPDEPAKTDEPVEDEEPEEPVDLEMYFFDLRMIGADHGPRIQAKLNEYLGENYGVNVNIHYFVIGEWITKVQLAIGSGERVDLMQLGAGSDVVTMHQKNMLVDISPYVEENCPEALELMEKYLEVYRMDGGLYGFPTFRGYVTNQYIIMRKDILEELGMVELAENMSCWTEFEQIMQAVKDNYTESTGLWALSKNSGNSTTPAGLWNGDNFSDEYTWDVLLDSVSMILTDDDGHVSWVLDDPRYTEKLERVATWADKGYIWPDSALVDIHGDELMKQGISFSMMDRSEYGIEAVKSNNCGHEVICVKYEDGLIVTDSLTGWGCGVPITAEEPEAACRMINALYTDKYVMDTLIRGIEGEDYTVVNGEVVYTEDPHYYEADFLIGNNLLLYPLEGQGADYFDQIKKINDAAKLGTYMGFAPDRSELELVIGSISAVNDQYSRSLTTGGYTPEIFAEYKAKLEDAGVHEYLDEMQRQLTAFLESK